MAQAKQNDLYFNCINSQSALFSSLTERRRKKKPGSAIECITQTLQVTIHKFFYKLKYNNITTLKRD
jgi:hypothetical protein